MGALLVVAGFVGCSDWNIPEREVFENQKDLEKYIPLLEAETEADLTPTMRDYFAKLREYRKTPHVKGFGWFGNWTGRGSNAQNYLKMLPDSVDFVSLWGTRGNLSEEQKKDLKFFQEVKGGKALLCWIVQDLGDQMTPPGRSATEYWVTEKGGGNFMEGVKAYANAIWMVLILTMNQDMVIVVQWQILLLLVRIQVILICIFLLRHFPIVCGLQEECW